MNYFLIILLLTITAVSCNEKKTSTYRPSYTGLPTGLNTVPRKLPSSQTNTPVQFGPNNTNSTSNPLLNGEQVQGNNQTTMQPVSSASSGKLNPAHGQPGHRCDLAEGAPLNSAPSLPAKNNATATLPAQTKIAPTEPGKNPPHGQPGHRCDIAVGAPLNSPAAKPASNPVITSASSTKTDTTVSTIFDTSSPGKSVKLNPPHGQPGHDCKIDVGKPLKQ